MNTRLEGRNIILTRIKTVTTIRVIIMIMIILLLVEEYSY